MHFFTAALLAGLTVASPVAEQLDARGFPSRNRPTTTSAVVVRPTPVRARSPPWASIVVASANGDGCPSGGSVTGVFSLYNTVLSLTYSQFKAIKTTTTDVRDRTKFCNLSVRLNAPAGWSYTATSIFYTGHVRLPTPDPATVLPATADPVCQANLTTTYKQNGVAAAADTGGQFTYSNLLATGVDADGNPNTLYDEDFNATSTLRSNYSPCTNGNPIAGPIFNINTRAAVNCNGDPDQDGALISVDTSDTRFVAGIEFTWRQCTPGQMF